jgi:hypothetical protein
MYIIKRPEPVRRAVRLREEFSIHGVSAPEISLNLVGYRSFARSASQSCQSRYAAQMTMATARINGIDVAS